MPATAVAYGELRQRRPMRRMDGTSDRICAMGRRRVGLDQRCLPELPTLSCTRRMASVVHYPWFHGCRTNSSNERQLPLSTLRQP
jgi:hypothetical protein